MLGIIPARGGSKSIPHKNIVHLHGLALIEWTIKACLESEYITTIAVSSDSDQIREVVTKYDLIFIERPPSLATDDARSEEVVKHALDFLSLNPHDVAHFALLQPTSPLRSSYHIDECASKYFSTESKSIISGFVPPSHPSKSFLIVDGFLQFLGDPEYPFMPRQKLPQAFTPNGAIYMTDTYSFYNTSSLFNMPVDFYLMSQEVSIDIDTYADLTKAAQWLKMNNIC